MLPLRRSTVGSDVVMILPFVMPEVSLAGVVLAPVGAVQPKAEPWIAERQTMVQA